MCKESKGTFRPQPLRALTVGNWVCPTKCAQLSRLRVLAMTLTFARSPIFRLSTGDCGVNVDWEQSTH